MSSHHGIFPAADLAAWQTLVGTVLRGASPKTLDRRDEDNLVLHAYHAGDPARAIDAAVVSSGMSADRRVAHGWDICQPVLALCAGQPDRIADCNRQILDAVSSGASALVLWIDLATADHFDRLFENLVLPAVSLQMRPVSDARLIMERLFAHLAASGLSVADLQIDLVHDFVTTRDDPGLSDRGAPPRLLIDGWRWHNAGLTRADEIGFCLAGCAAMLRDAADPAGMASRLGVSVALSADILATTVKLRALRLGWAGLLNAFGLAESDCPLFIDGMTSLRMFSLLDMDVNMLRNTTALLGGALGGADRMSAFGHDVQTGESDAGRRLTRMTQLMMIEESGLARTLDPLAGAPLIEARTDELAVVGWAAMQRIEQNGGLGEDAARADLQTRAEAAANARLERYAAGDDPADDQVGVTLQPADKPPGELASGSAPLFAGVRRPSAAIETLRRAAQTAAPRVVMLCPESDDSNSAAQERAVRKWLAIAGVTALRLADTDVDGVAAARADAVICIDDCAFAHGDGVLIMSASDVLARPDRLAGLQQIIDVALQREGV